MGINQSINQLMTYDMTIYDMTYGHLEREMFMAEQVEKAGVQISMPPLETKNRYVLHYVHLGRLG